MLFPKLHSIAPQVGFPETAARQELALLDKELLRTAREAYALPDTDDPFLVAAMRGQQVAQWFEDPAYVYATGSEPVPDLVRKEVKDSLPSDARDSKTVVTIAAAAPFFNGASLNRAMRGILTGISRDEMLQDRRIKPSVYSLAQLMTGKATA